jgi:CheY-like chemotaxis protein
VRDEELAVLRILVVDDYVPATQAIAQLLRIAGNVVATSYTAHRVVEVAVEFQPAVILLDISLNGPDDGLAVARLLRAEPRLDGVVLVAMTGRHDTDLEAQIAAAGFDHYLLKPVGFDEIEAILSSATPDRAAPGTKGQ